MVSDQTSPGKVVVTADGDGVLSHAGSTLLVGLADKIGLTEALSVAMEPTRERVSAHDPGVVLRDLAVMLVDGGTCLSDLGGQRERAARLGEAVASDSTAYRVISSIDRAGLERLRDAVATARARAWELGAGVGGPVVLDFDATLVGAYSRKQGAAGTFKGGFGHHPLLCYLDGSKEALASVLRDGNAGSNTAADHMTVGDLALAQLPARAVAGEIVARVDGAGATHEFTRWCRDANIAFSVGGALSQDVLNEALLIDDRAGQQAICRDGSEDADAWVSELTGRLSSKLATWPSSTRLVCRAVRLAEGTQLGFGQTDGFRYEVFFTDRRGDIRDLDLFQREHARVEDRIRDAKDLGLRNLPFVSLACNEAWLLLSGLAQDLLAWSEVWLTCI